MNQRKHALATARRLRTCPPVGVMNDPAQARQVAAHRRICPYCAATRPEADEFRPSTVGGDKPGGRHRRMAAPGDICAVSASRACWREEYFYSPPCVLILAMHDADQSVFLVAQVYWDTLLAAPGDLVLSRRQTGIGDLLVECWNHYTLAAGFLGDIVGRVSGRVLDAARAMAEGGVEAQPDWAPLPRPMQMHDPRYYFREMEVEVGYTFAVESATRILERFHPPSPHLTYDSADAVQADLRRFHDALQWRVAPADPLEALALARPPDLQLPLAAADESTRLLPVRLVHLTKGRITDFRLLAAEIYRQDAHADAEFAEGRIAGLEGVNGPVRLVAYLEVDEKDVLEARVVDFDPDKGFFSLTFHGTGASRITLYLAVLAGDDDA